MAPPEAAAVAAAFPIPLHAYPAAHESVLATLSERISIEPFNAIASGIFFLAVLHTFAAARFAALARRVQQRHDTECVRMGRPPTPSVAAELLHFFGEIEVIFGLWAVVLAIALTAAHGWNTARHYFNDTVNYTEPLFVVVIMALAATRPIIGFAEHAMQRLASLGRGTPAAWWLAILIVGPLLGSLITEPGAMTVSALLLGRRFYDLNPSTRLKYATLGLLFVNISIGGTLTHFAAPPVLMVSRPWNWDTAFMLGHFGWRATVSVVFSALAYLFLFRREFAELALRNERPDTDEPQDPHATLLPVPAWVTAVHMGFMAWTVFTAHYPGLFVGGFLFFLGFAKATARYQSRLDLGSPLLVGFFLAGLVIHGGLQGWWIGPVLGSLGEEALFFGAAFLTAFNDNALITYLATLVPSLGMNLKVAVVEGAVTGGGLTVIANAPNPAGQALLGRFFDDAVSPLGLLAGAIVPTVVATVIFRLVP